MIDFHGVRIDEAAVGQVSGTYEPEEMELADLLFDRGDFDRGGRGDRVVTGGCGMGWLAAWIARRVGPDNLVAVEPQRGLVDLVRQNVAVDGQPLTVRWGAFDPDGAAVVVDVDEDNWACTRTRRWSPVTDADTAPGVDLRHYVHAGWDCLAIDIEGAEVDVLTEDVLAGTRKLLVDLHRFAVDTGPLEKRIAAAGLRLVAERDRMPRENACHQAWTR